MVLTIIVEGVLAPSSELSERKWRRLNPVAADIGHGANIDELRHLGVGADIIRNHLRDNPEEKNHILSIIQEGRDLWSTLPASETVYKREVLFQQGLLDHKDLVGDYELYPGKRLIDTSIDDRLELGMKWSNELQNTRLIYMGLEEAVLDA